MLRRVFISLWASAALLTLSSCKKQVSTQNFIDPLLQRLVSGDTTVIGVCDLTALKTTALYARHRSQMDIPLLNEISSQTGFDPRRDISELLLTWSGKDLMIAAKGQFDKRRIELSLTTSSKPTEYKNYALFGDGREMFVLLDSKLLLAGKLQVVHSTIDGYQANTGKVPEEFSQSLAQRSRAEQIWLVSRGGLPFADAATRTDVASILSNFAGYVGFTSTGIIVDDGLHLKAMIDCVSEQGSKRMDDGLRGGIGLARLALRDKQPDLVQIYNAIHVRKDGETVYVSADLSGALADDLLTRLGGLKSK